MNGALNGNTGVMKSMVGELTDSTNSAQAFALLPLTWAIGVTFGYVLILAERNVHKSTLDTQSIHWRDVVSAA